MKVAYIIGETKSDMETKEIKCIKFNLEFETIVTSSFFFDEDGSFDAIEKYEGEPFPADAIICNDDDEAIGYLHGYRLYDSCDTHIKCDNVSGDCEIIAAAICNKNGAVSKKYLSNDYNEIFILDCIEIDKQFRGRGIASAIILNLPRLLHYEFGCDSTVFLCASDYEAASEYGFGSEEYKNGTRKLINFYRKFGYKLIKDNVMYCKSSDHAE